MNDFKWRHFAGDIILHCVRWYCKYGISYRELEEMMEERGITIDHTTLYRWVQTYAPEIEKRLRWYRKGSDWDGSWRVDETYIKIKGEWKYLYRAVNAHGRTIDFYLSSTRTISAATIFLKKALRAAGEWNQPRTITTDKNPTYGVALAAINAERKEGEKLEHRMCKYLNNIVEADHGKLKRLIKPTLGFKSMTTAYATLKGFEVMRMFKKRQFAAWYSSFGLDVKGVTGEIRLINQQFGIYAV
jgi:transposase-like protein